jgi:hypothetical protein
MPIDGTKPGNLSNGVLSEEKTRDRLLGWAATFGDKYLYRDLLLIFEKFDKKLRLCKNEKERKDIAELGIMEIYRAMSSRTGLSKFDTNGEKLIICD